MMVVGVDPHKQCHTAVAVDELGRKHAHKTVKARRKGHLAALAWARRLAGEAGLVWAVEDVRHVAGNLVRDLLAAGERVVFVPPRLMAGERRGGRERGKSDPIDGLAIARAALREDLNLPTACLDERTGPSGCWPTTATRWWPNAPGSSTGSAGTCTTWPLTWHPRRGHYPAPPPAPGWLRGGHPDS